MVDERVVAVKLEQIEQYHGELNAKRETLSRQEFLSSTTEQRAVERMFENAIQTCADLAQHVASREFEFDGTTSKGAIRVLDREGMIDEEAADTLVAAIGFRNFEMCLHTSTGTLSTARYTKPSRPASLYTRGLASR
nr:HepT-like ribonuclease domain-containing protein [Halorubrum sp. Atlit-28R]